MRRPPPRSPRIPLFNQAACPSGRGLFFERAQRRLRISNVTATKGNRTVTQAPATEHQAGAAGRNFKASDRKDLDVNTRSREFAAVVVTAVRAVAGGACLLSELAYELAWPTVL
jgi:hypothetical protein